MYSTLIECDNFPNCLSFFPVGASDLVDPEPDELPLGVLAVFVRPEQAVDHVRVLVHGEGESGHPVDGDARLDQPLDVLADLDLELREVVPQGHAVDRGHVRVIQLAKLEDEIVLGRDGVRPGARAAPARRHDEGGLLQPHRAPLEYPRPVLPRELEGSGELGTRRVGVVHEKAEVAPERKEAPLLSLPHFDHLGRRPHEVVVTERPRALRDFVASLLCELCDSCEFRSSLHWLAVKTSKKHYIVLAEGSDTLRPPWNVRLTSLLLVLAS